jgi:hypothetical protein
MQFLYRLALKLGIWNVEEPGGLADVMSVDQLYGWMGYYQLEPWGDEWLRDAMSMAQFASAHRSKGSPRRKPDDFMPVPKRTQTPEQIVAAFRAIGGG